MTQTQQIRAHLLKHNSITPLEALRRYGCMRLAARIKELREGGFSITTTMVNRDGTRYAKYIPGMT